MTSSPNPFHFGKAVSGADFCPRTKLEAALREKLRAVQNTLVQGDRRMGKTSLIRRAAQSLPGYREIYVDLFGVRTIDAVVKRFAAARRQRRSRFNRSLNRRASARRNGRNAGRAISPYSGQFCPFCHSCSVVAQHCEVFAQSKQRCNGHVATARDPAKR